MDAENSEKCGPSEDFKCVVPYSCCADQSDGKIKDCQKDPEKADQLGRLKQGCWEEFDVMIDDNQSYILCQYNVIISWPQKILFGSPRRQILLTPAGY